MPKNSVVDEAELKKAWDSCVVETMTHKNDGAFYGSILCAIKMMWTDQVETIVINPDMELKWNPQWFLSLTKEERLYVLMHMLTHISLLHMPRMGNREADLWAKATNYEINSVLRDGEFKMPWGNLEMPHDPKYKGLSAEEIYQELLQEQEQEQQQQQGGGGESDGDPEGSWGTPELSLDPKNGSGDSDGDGGSDSPSEGSSPMTAQQANDMIGTVAKATQEAQMGGKQPGAHAQVSKGILDRFLKSQLPWNNFLRKFMIDKLAKRLSWKRPKRRHQDVYLPARRPHDNGLTDITIYMDTSGSITDKMVQILNSEVKFIHENFKPKNLRVVQFDTGIRDVTTYTRGSRIVKMKIAGRGGTCLDCVHQDIEENKPKIAVILSDLECYPMDTVKGTELLWIVFGNEDAQVRQGRAFHVDV